MIKVQIDDIGLFRTEYSEKFHPIVKLRLKRLAISLRHLTDPDSILDTEIAKAKSITKAIVDSLVTPKTSKGAFKKNVYRNKILSYKDDAKEVEDIDFDKLALLTNYLLDESNSALETLLTGHAHQLKAFHDNLFVQFDITDKLSMDVMYEAFSYVSLGEEVRGFFYARDLSDYCSYCNISKARRTKNPKTGKVVDQYHLDHFFSQVDHPMLATSLFNLVPSDYVCNSANKDDLLFSDEFHLNPYISGFKRDMVFEPVLNEMGEHILSIDLKIRVNRNSSRWKQLIGDEDDRDLAPQHGNINVFELYGKYNDENLIWQMNQLYKCYKRIARNDRSIQETLDLIEDGQNDRYMNIKKWYEELARTRFHESEFGKHPFSKLHRDLLDYTFAVYADNLGAEVAEIIESSYDPSRGGE